MVSYTAMRTILYLLLLLFFWGCKKEDNSPVGQLRGTWELKKSVYSSGSSPDIISGDPRRPVKLILTKDGTFYIDAEPRLSPLQSYLPHFDRYEVLPDNKVRFYSDSDREGILFQFELGKQLEFYRSCREACSDFFVKSY